MEQLFTKNDVERWETTHSRKVDILRRRLGEAPEASEDVQGLNMLSLAHVDMGFTNFAKGECASALDHLRLAVRLKLRIFELHANGYEPAQGYIRTGEFSTVLLGYASGDSALACQFAESYSCDQLATEHSPDDSNFIGLPLKALALGKFEEAKTLLSRTKPEKIDPQFAGYIECLEAVAAKDTADFLSAIQDAELKWHSFMSKRFRGHPQAVCFVGGLGMQRLAELSLETEFHLRFCCSTGTN